MAEYWMCSLCELWLRQNAACIWETYEWREYVTAAHSAPSLFSVQALSILHDGTVINRFNGTSFVVCHLCVSGKQSHSGERVDASYTIYTWLLPHSYHPSAISIFWIPEWRMTNPKACNTQIQLESEKLTLFSKCWMVFVCHVLKACSYKAWEINNLDTIMSIVYSNSKMLGSIQQ